MKINNISEEGVWRLVDELARVRSDTELARIFHRAIPGNWGLHLATMRDFWSSVTGRYKGNPAAVHLRMEGMEPRLFDRRLELFSETCGELHDDCLAEAPRTKAHRIAESQNLALFYRP